MDFSVSLSFPAVPVYCRIPGTIPAHWPIPAHGPCWRQICGAGGQVGNGWCWAVSGHRMPCCLGGGLDLTSVPTDVGGGRWGRTLGLTVTMVQGCLPAWKGGGRQYHLLWQPQGGVGPECPAANIGG